jgi:hypothetical protein
MIAWSRSNDGVRSWPPYSTSFTANTAVPASPKCGNSFFFSRLGAIWSEKRIAMSAIPAAPLVGIAILATIGQPHSTKLATFTEPPRLQPADGAVPFSFAACSSWSGRNNRAGHPLGAGMVLLCTKKYLANPGIDFLFWVASRRMRLYTAADRGGVPFRAQTRLPNRRSPNPKRK